MPGIQPPLFIRPHTTDAFVHKSTMNEFPALVAALVSGAARNSRRSWTVLDAGANVGFASRHFARLPGARVVALEVEHANFAALQAK